MSNADDIIAGSVAIGIMQHRLWADHASTMHAEMIYQLERIGFEVSPEFKTGELGDNRNRRIDIVASLDDGNVGIELDCRRPRQKSISKLLLFPGYRIIGLRGIEGHYVEGIDACVSMRVRVASKSEKSDRRIYRPLPTWAEDWRRQ